MPGFLIQQGATVLCSHGGQAQPTVANPSVTLSSMPSLLLSSPWVIGGCPLVPPPIPPCVSAQWLTGTTRVTSFGQPLLVQSGASICVPPGTPLVPIATQTRVSAI